MELHKLCEILNRPEAGLLDEIEEADFSCENILDVIGHINQNRKKIKSTMALISGNTISTVTSLAEISRSLDSIQTKSRELADYSSTIASAGEELSATINSISRNVQNTVEASAQAKQLATRGMTVVDSTK